MGALRACLVMGTRSEAVKLAPLLQASRRRRDVEFCICSTGEQPELLQPIVDYFRLAVDLQLNLTGTGRSDSEPLARTIAKLDDVFDRHQPDCVVGQGDTGSAMAAAIAAGRRQIPFVHLDAGTRAFRLPSQHRLVPPATTMHCVPTRLAVQQLCAEGVPRHSIHLTGFTAVDALQWSLERERQRADYWQSRYRQLGERHVLLVALSDRDHEARGLDEICVALQSLSPQLPEVEFVFPLPHNPALQTRAQQCLKGLGNVHLLEQASYPEHVWLLDRCTWVLSNSQTVLAEAMSLLKPVLSLQAIADSPVWASDEPVTPIGTSAGQIVPTVLHRVSQAATSTVRRRIPSAGFDGRAAERIVDLMAARAWNEPMTVRRAA